MLLNKTILVKWNVQNKQYYLDKEYKFSKIGDIIEIKIEDVPLNSNRKVDVLCDYCNKNISHKTYQAYNSQRNIIQKDSCHKCKFIKIKESNLKIYGVEHKCQLESEKIAIGNKNKKYNTEFVIEKIKEKDYSLLDGYEYKNSITDLPFVCNKHHNLGIQHTTFTEFLQNNDCCKSCIGERKSELYRKYNFDEVYEIFNKLDCELVTKEYINRYQLLDFICNHHREKGSRTTTMSAIETNKNICVYCRDILGTNLPVDIVKSKFNDKNFRMVNDDDYKNYYSEIRFICNKHEECGVQLCNYNQLKHNKSVCKKCLIELKEQNRINKENQLFIEMRLEGLIPTINARYDDINSTITYTCINHPYIVQMISVRKFNIGRRCILCAIDKNSGSTHYNYQGGISNLNNYLRGLLRPLVDEKLKEYNYRCFITGKNGTLEVHHLYNFNKMVKDVLKKLNLQVKENVEDYTETEINNINKVFLNYHTENWGIPILPQLHKLFHNQYGLKNNSDKQFFEFVDNCKNGIIK